MWKATLITWTAMVALLTSTVGLAASEAEIRMRAGDVAGALPLARDAALRDPGALDAQELFIDLGLSLGLRHHVEAIYRQRLADSPDSADAHYLMGRVVMSAEEAKAEYDKALELDPEHARAPMGLGAVQRALGELEEAKKSYRTALARDRTLVEAWTGLQAALLQQGRIGEAQAEARRFLEAVPDSPEPYIAVATLERDRANDVLAVGVKRVPDDPHLRALYARSLLDAGKADEASRQADAALERAPGYAEVQFLRMVAREMQRGTLNVEGWQEMGRARDVEDAAAARAAWSGITQRYPRSALGWLGLAKVLGATGDSKGAIAPLAKAARLAPDEVEVHATYGLALVQAGRPGDAVPWLMKAVSARPRDASLMVALIQALIADDRPGEARVLAVKAYEAHPHDLRVALVTAQVLSQQGDPNGAYIALRDALPRIPDPRLVVALAAAARDAGNYAEAADLLDRLGRTIDNETARDLAVQLRAEAKAHE